MQSVGNVQACLKKRSEIQAVLYHLKQELASLKQELHDKFGVDTKEQATAKLEALKAEEESLAERINKECDKINSVYNDLKNCGVL